MKISDLGERERRERLLGGGLAIRTGSFVYKIRSNLPGISDLIGLVYGEFPAFDLPALADFHIGVHACRSWVRPWRKRVAVAEGGVPLFKPCPLKEAFAYLEWGMNACIAWNAHHWLLLHAASLEKEGRGVLFLGSTGIGKSTMAAALAAWGWRLLSDECGIVEMDSLRLLALARPICLKNEAIDLIKAWNPGAVFTVPEKVRRKGLLCHMAPPAESVRRMEEKAVPQALVFPDFQPGAVPRLSELSKPEAMRRAIACSFNYRELGRAGFDCLARLVDACECYELKYGDLEGGVRVAEDILERAAASTRGAKG